MASEALERIALTVMATDVPTARRVAEALHQEDLDRGARSVTLITATGQRLHLAGQLVSALHMIASLLAQGDDVALVPLHRDLSLDEAAILLGVSALTLGQLLDRGEIPATESATARRIHLANLLAYKERRSAQNRAHLAEALAVAQEARAYD